MKATITEENVEALGCAKWDVGKDMLDEAYDDEDTMLFRNTMWLAQLVSIGKQFRVRKTEFD